MNDSWLDIYDDDDIYIYSKYIYIYTYIWMPTWTQPQNLVATEAISLKRFSHEVSLRWSLSPFESTQGLSEVMQWKEAFTF